MSSIIQNMTFTDGFIIIYPEKERYLNCCFRDVTIKIDPNARIYEPIFINGYFHEDVIIEAPQAAFINSLFKCETPWNKKYGERTPF